MTRLTKILAPAALLALVGSAANAQFVAEGSAPTIKSHDNPQSVQVMSVTNNDGHTYNLRVEDGDVVSVRVDGKDVPDNLVRREGDKVVIVDDKGRETFTFNIAIPDVPPVPAVRGVPAPTPPPAGVQSDAQSGGRWLQRFDPPAQLTTRGRVRVTGDVSVQAPPVMLGINLGEPGDALRSHLGLGDKDAILVEGVVDGLPADKAGLKLHDVIVSINGSDGASGEVLHKILAGAKPGDTLELGVRRGGDTVKIKAELAAYDADKLGTTEIEIQGLNGQDPFAGGAWTIPAPPTPPDLPRIDGQESEHEAAARRYAEQAERMAAEMQRKAEEAMREVGRQTLEFKDGRLFLRSDDALREQIDRLQQQLRQNGPIIQDDLDARLSGLEQRLDSLESQLDQRMQRLADLMDRLADRLEKGADKHED